LAYIPIPWGEIKKKCLNGIECQQQQSPLFREDADRQRGVFEDENLEESNKPVGIFNGDVPVSR